MTVFVAVLNACWCVTGRLIGHCRTAIRCCTAVIAWTIASQKVWRLIFRLVFHDAIFTWVLYSFWYKVILWLSVFYLLCLAVSRETEPLSFQMLPLPFLWSCTWSPQSLSLSAMCSSCRLLFLSCISIHTWMQGVIMCFALCLSINLMMCLCVVLVQQTCWWSSVSHSSAEALLWWRTEWFFIFVDILIRFSFSCALEMCKLSSYKRGLEPDWWQLGFLAIVA